MTICLHQPGVSAVSDTAHPAGSFLPVCHRHARSFDARNTPHKYTQLLSAGTRRNGTISMQAVPSQTAQASLPAKPDPFSAPAMLFVGFSTEEVAVLEECFADDTTLGVLPEPSDPPKAT